MMDGCGANSVLQNDFAYLLVGMCNEKHQESLWRKELLMNKGEKLSNYEDNVYDMT